jgi:hypothetical protein
MFSIVISKLESAKPQSLSKKKPSMEARKLHMPKRQGHCMVIFVLKGHGFAFLGLKRK